MRQCDEFQTGLSLPTEIRKMNSVIQYLLTGAGEKSSINRHRCVRYVRTCELWPRVSLYDFSAKT